jgi:branched-chain amino acid transport system permease protein
MPSATLLGQAFLSGLFLGGLYGLLGLGLSLSWGYLRLINLAHFGFAFLAAYLTYQLSSVAGLNVALAILAIVPLFFTLGLLMQFLLTRFAIGEFASLLVTFGVTVIVEAFIQWLWTADLRRLQLPHGHASLQFGSLFIPVVEGFTFLICVALSLGVWAWIRFTYIGKALRASAENPDIAAAFGIDHARLAYIVSGVAMGCVGVGGAFIALSFALFPAQIFAWIGIIFAVVILGGIGNALGVLLAGIGIGVSEAVTMAVTEPTWAPLVSFSLLIAALVFRREHR